jgi:nucleotide-binding universal stress UspA family protein
MEHIVVGFDGSANARRALERAGALAEPGSRITVIAAAQEPVLVPHGSPPSGAEGLEERRAEVEEARGLLAGRGLVVDLRAVVGAPADVIVEEAARSDADLIVVGARGLNGAERLVMGSVSSKVARTAACSVLIVR